MKKKKKVKAKIRRTSEGKYVKGECGNPSGRPKGSTNRYSLPDLMSAIKVVEKKKQKTFLQKWIESAWGNANDMSKIMEFMLPRLKSIEGLMATFESSMTDDLAKSIQDKLRKQYERK